MRAPLSIAFLVLLLACPAWAGAAGDGDKAAGEGDWDSAVTHYLDAHNAKPNDRALLLKLADAARRTRKREALDAARDALLDVTAKNTKDWEAWVALGGVTLERARTLQKGTTIAMEYDDAKASFRRAIEGSPDMESAYTGLAQVHRAQADPERAMKILDDYLKRGAKPQAGALYWKAQLHYDRALADFNAKGGVYPLTDVSRQAFGKAQGLYQASTTEDPSDYEAWMQLAYTSQFLGDYPGAQEAYTKAVPLNLHSQNPIRGLGVLFGREPDKVKSITAQLVKDHPKHPALHYHVGYQKYVARDYAKALKHFQVYAEHGNNPGNANFYVGLCYENLDKPKKAREAYLKALAANPNDDRPAVQLEAPLRAEGLKRAMKSVKSAQELIKDYEEILKLAPRSPAILNNIAFTLREAHGRNRGNSKWVPILKACRDYYVRASEVIGPYTAASASLSFADRHGKAQIISDTGLMFQFYGEIRDYEKAEEYYNTALEFSGDSYFDAWNNLTTIYTEQKRWQDLYDLAAVGADKLVANEAGAPHEMGRRKARQIMKKLKDEGKAED